MASRRGINKVILVGNVGKEPEIRYMPNGNPVVNIILATSDIWKDKNTGENKIKTEWHRVVIFGKIAEIANEYVKKGSQIYIEGYLQTRKWQNKNGQDNYITEIIVSIGGTMQILNNFRMKENELNNEINKNLNDKENKIQEQWNDKKITSSINKNNNENMDIKKNIDNAIDFEDDIPF